MSRKNKQIKLTEVELKLNEYGFIKNDAVGIPGVVEAYKHSDIDDEFYYTAMHEIKIAGNNIIINKEKNEIVASIKVDVSFDTIKELDTLIKCSIRQL